MHANDLIERVTAELIAAIEDGAGTWTMPWHTIATTDQPRSADHRPYRTGAAGYSNRPNRGCRASCSARTNRPRCDDLGSSGRGPGRFERCQCVAERLASTASGSRVRFAPAGCGCAGAGSSDRERR